MSSYRVIKYDFFITLLGFTLLFALPGCEIFNDVGPSVITRTYNLHMDRDWTADFSDYPVNREEQLELQAGYRNLPSPLDTSRTAFYLAGTNTSDNLFMFIKRAFSGLQPGKRYQFSIEVTFATDVPSNCAGIGGAPGESVYVKGGVSSTEPRPISETRSDQRVYRMNVDKGLQSNGGSNAMVLGNIANSRDCEQERRYERKTLTSPDSLTLHANETGKVWLFVGTDSAFEGRTELYYTEVKIRASRL